MILVADLRRYRLFCWACGALYLVLAVVAAAVRWVFVIFTGGELPLGLYAQDLLCALTLVCLAMLLFGSGVAISRDRPGAVRGLAAAAKWTSAVGGALCVVTLIIAWIAADGLDGYANIVATGLALLAVVQTQSAVSELRED